MGLPRTGRHKRKAKRVRDSGRNLILQAEDVRCLTVKAIGPELFAGLGINQPRVDADLTSSPLYRALQKIPDIQFAAHLRRVNLVALIGKGRPARDDKQVGNIHRELGRQVFDNAVAKIVLRCVATEIVERH